MVGNLIHLLSYNYCENVSLCARNIGDTFVLESPLFNVW